MAVEYPVAEFFLPFVERQIPVGSFAHFHRFAGESRARIDKVGDVQRRAAGLTLVAVGVFIAAAWACAGHVAVGKEFLGLFVVWLKGCLDSEFTLVVKVTEEFGSCLVMEFGGGT